MPNAIEVEAVEQQFRSGFWLKPVQILKGITFQVPRGTIFGLLGPNGAGKTSLIHLLTGLRNPTVGRVRIDGFEAASLEARSRIGYLPERPYFSEFLTAEGFLNYSGSLAGMSSQKIRERSPTLLKLVGLEHARRLQLRKFSKGMLQRVGIAQALLSEPSVLIFDEPMSGLDPMGRKEIRELMLQLAQEGRTLIFSSHVIPDVESICHEIALIHRGRLLALGPIGELLKKGDLKTEIGFKTPPGSQQTIQEMEWPEFDYLTPMPGGYRGLIMGGQEMVNRVLMRMIQSSIIVLWVNPVRQSLEDFFAESTRLGQDS